MRILSQIEAYLNKFLFGIPTKNFEEGIFKKLLDSLDSA